MELRYLTEDERTALAAYGCRAECWDRILVHPQFSPDRCRNVRFVGAVELGRFSGVTTGGDGIVHPTGIYESTLADAVIGDDCLVMRSSLFRVDVAVGAVIWDAPSIVRTEATVSAIGSPVHVLTEDGARSVPLHPGLNAALAHVIAHGKGSDSARALEAVLLREADNFRPDRCRVGAGCRVVRTGPLRDVWLGDGALVMDAAGLADCHLAASPTAPVHIGEGAAASGCVFQAGCRVSGGARLDHCLVGEGVVLENQFAARHSLFFANSHFALGEASSVLAGPHSSSMHKASLALTCECSFATLGSATNSSNHHFKLGPVHGGVLRRGVRCGSGSYIYWPSDIGAFTTVVGRHTMHLDSAIFPFSLLTGTGEESVLVPAVGLFTAGLQRDEAKWPNRDRRNGIDQPVDMVNPRVLSPYTLQAVEQAILLLREAEGVGVDLRHGNAVIPAAGIVPALRLYEAAITFAIGVQLLDGPDEQPPASTGSIMDRLAELPPGDSDPSMGEWRDWGGLLLSGHDASSILDHARRGLVTGVTEFRRRLAETHRNYRRNAFYWAARRWRREYGAIRPDTLARFFEAWRRAVDVRHDRLLRDIGKEFTGDLAFGFGVEEDGAAAFARVRGTADTQPLAAVVRQERDCLLARADGIA